MSGLRQNTQRELARAPTERGEAPIIGVPGAEPVASGSPTGFWRMSGHPAVQKALRNHVLDSLGLPRIYVAS